MRAIRTCECSVISNSPSAVFSISKTPTFLPGSPSPNTEGKGENSDKQAEGNTETEAETGTDEDAGEDRISENTKANEGPKDPIRMFGILVPRALREAQGSSIKMVEELVPKLASVDAEMREVEIEIRRKRKFRGKAEMAEKKGVDLSERERGEGVTV
jgi:coiled-coil domain-containing protein 115